MKEKEQDLPPIEMISMALTPDMIDFLERVEKARQEIHALVGIPADLMGAEKQPTPKMPTL